MKEECEEWLEGFLLLIMNNVESRKGCAGFVNFQKKRKSRYKTEMEFQRVIMAPEYDSSTRIRIFA